MSVNSYFYFFALQWGPNQIADLFNTLLNRPCDRSRRILLRPQELSSVREGLYSFP
uniref:Uncharacterized protein n=1 Tax=Anguilla anguilla TaxID=7936 RepID=A0A0E9X7S9_ANGAN